MPIVKNSSESIGDHYPTTTGRLKQIRTQLKGLHKKVALLGDSTIDNGYWIQKDTPYPNKTHNVTHQTAMALASLTNTGSYDLANFAVDGATTSDLLNYCYLNKVLNSDNDHPAELVDQLQAVCHWQPDIAVLSVGGNNYREALASTLLKRMNYPQLLLRFTPAEAKPMIREAFTRVKAKLLNEYKQIIDKLVAENAELSRIVLLSQYYPAITELTPYFIYSGFSHVAHADGKGATSFVAVEETMNELYREVLSYAATKNKEIVFVDMTSSLNPLGGNHTFQIEPNEQGSKLMGKLIAHALDYQFIPSEEKAHQSSIVAIVMNPDEASIHTIALDNETIKTYGVKKINQFISDSRYRHLGLLFSPSTNLTTRYESAYQAVVGRQFDSDFSGLFAFGLLDLSLITIAASYLWRVAVNDELHMALRVAAGVIAAPVLLARMIVGLALMLVLALPIYGYHKAFSSLPENEDALVQFEEAAEEENRSTLS
ncbi:MAG: SGNH/GDSL hydrolase family protein [Tatlockia sp.]|nr:SGNH/GDSL hydrolase family protein [Tatlockia sp.]